MGAFWLVVLGLLTPLYCKLFFINYSILSINECIAILFMTVFDLCFTQGNASSVPKFLFYIASYVCLCVGVCGVGVDMGD